MFRLQEGYIMIVSKYFNSNQDFINLIKVNKKYKDLIECFKFNPISDPQLFVNIETQHFYKNDDFIFALPKMYRYIYWGEFTKEQKIKLKEINQNNYKFNNYDNKINLKDKLIEKNNRNRIINKILINSNYKIKKLIYDSNINKERKKLKGNILEIFEDNNNNILAIQRGVNNLDIQDFNLNLPIHYIKIFYLDNNNNIIIFNNFSNNYNLESGSNGILIKFNNGKIITIEPILNSNNKFNLEINNIGLTNLELKNFIFGNYLKKNSIKVNLKRYSIYKLKNNFNDNYYNNLLKRNLNIIYDSWKEPSINQNINLGFLKYIYIDNNGNYICYNILPTEIIITLKINNNYKIFKPLGKMLEFINNFNIKNSLYFRYNFKDELLYNYYDKNFYEMIEPLNNFEFKRLIICSNNLTKNSCVMSNKYFINVYKEKLCNY